MNGDVTTHIAVNHAARVTRKLSASSPRAMDVARQLRPESSDSSRRKRDDGRRENANRERQPSSDGRVEIRDARVRIDSALFALEI